MAAAAGALLLGALLIVSSCGHLAPAVHDALDRAEIYEGAGQAPQLRLQYRTTVYDPLPNRSSHTRSHWIPLTGTGPEFSVEAAVGACPLGMHTFASYYPTRGRVTTTGSTVRVGLEQLKRDAEDKPPEWRPYEFNGDYRLVDAPGSARSAATSENRNCKDRE